MFDLFSMIGLFLGFVLISLVAGNNLAVCVGSAIASRMISKQNGIAITVVGYILGLLAQGSYLSHTISLLVPSIEVLSIDLALLITILIFIIAEIKRVPQSLTVTLTTVLVGINAGLKTGLNLSFMTTIVIFWITMPLLAFLFMFKMMKILSRRAPQSHIWSYVKLIRIVLLLTSFAVAFTLGGNTIGLITALLPQTGYTLAIVFAAIVFGSIAFSGGTLSRVGNDIIPLRYMNAVGSQFMSALAVEIATVFQVPLSNTEAFISSVYGVGVSYRERLILSRPFIIIISMWIVTAFIGLIAGYAAIRLSYPFLGLS